MNATAIIGIALISAILLSTSVDAARSPWDMARLRQPLRYEIASRDGNLVSIYYEGEPRKGKPTRIFAYIAYPQKSSGRMPAVVLVHGGLGRAFPDWARMWADRGYVALAMDHFGHGPDGKPLPDGGPDIGNPFSEPDVKEAWPYHAVADVVRGVSLLASLPEVDPKRIGITGISWGGYLTCIAAGLDDRLKAAAPVYGCGFLHEGSACQAGMQQMEPKLRTQWIDNFDPSRYVGQAKMPMLFLNSTNDTFFWFGSYQKTYGLVKNHTLCIKPDMTHGQEQGASPVEIGLFMDQWLRDGKPLPKPGKAHVKGNDVEMEFASPVPLASAVLIYTTDTGDWKDRKWITVPAKIEGAKVRAQLPDARPVAWFINVTDARGAVVGSEIR
jgi:dienelactone hydrolase